MVATAPHDTSTKPPAVGLFVTCLVNVMRPQVGFAALKLLEAAGCKVTVPLSQSCCGQPAYNSGATAQSAAFARQLITQFEGFDYVVAPSGSCAATIKISYPEMLQGDAVWAARARNLADKTWELTSFLVDVCHYRPENVQCPATATYHDSCSGLRQLDILAQPRQLLSAVQGLEMKPLAGHDVCCGFGGTFCVKYPDISNQIVGDKAAAVTQAGAALLLGGDLGCLMNMAGKLSRQGSRVKSYHVAEVLAGMADGPPLCGEEG